MGDLRLSSKEVGRARIRRRMPGPGASGRGADSTGATFRIGTRGDNSIQTVLDEARERLLIADAERRVGHAPERILVAAVGQEVDGRDRDRSGGPGDRPIL